MSDVKHEQENAGAARSWLPACILATCCSLAGCNEFWTPTSIEPSIEIASNSGDVEFESATLAIPSRWSIRRIDRHDDGHPWVANLEMLEGRRRYALLTFTELDQPPGWINIVDVQSTSTSLHQHVDYRIVSEREPSGDDTPGRYSIWAHVKVGDANWEMRAVFFTPVEPDLLDAVNYVDAISPHD